jgi:ABC-type branched-subunit amino acid transport system ATPase component
MKSLGVTVAGILAVLATPATTKTAPSLSRGCFYAGRATRPGQRGKDMGDGKRVDAIFFSEPAPVRLCPARWALTCRFVMGPDGSERSRTPWADIPSDRATGGVPGVTTVQGAIHTTHRDGSESHPALALSDITVRFGGITALQEVSLRLDAGEVRGLIGPNGAGKTTLFDVISGIRLPDAGRVELDGREITGLSAVRRARLGLRRTFQRVQTFGWLSVEDNVLAALEWRSGGGGLAADLVSFPTRLTREKERRARVAHVTDLCGLTPVRHETAGSLPIGLGRMVELARAIVDAPRVLLLDEPTSGLDETEAARLGERIQDIRAHESCAVLLVEHDVGFVMRQCDRIVVMHLGELLAEGRPEQIRANPAVRAAYLGDD